MKNEKITGHLNTIIHHDGKDYVILSFLEGHMEDQGIGQYEFWGFVGYHSDWVAIVDECFVTSIDAVEAYEIISDVTRDEIIKDFEDKLYDGVYDDDIEWDDDSNEN